MIQDIIINIYRYTVRIVGSIYSGKSLRYQMRVYIYVGNSAQIGLHCCIKTFNFRIAAIGIILYRPYRYEISLRSTISPFSSFGINIADVVNCFQMCITDASCWLTEILR